MEPKELRRWASSSRHCVDDPADGFERDLAALGIVGLAVCCGLPVLLAAGAGVTVLGVGLRSWTLIVVGSCAAIAGFITWRRRQQRSRCETGDDTVG